MDVNIYAYGSADRAVAYASLRYGATDGDNDGDTHGRRDAHYGRHTRLGVQAKKKPVSSMSIAEAHSRLRYFVAFLGYFSPLYVSSPRLATRTTTIRTSSSRTM